MKDYFTERKINVAVKRKPAVLAYGGLDEHSHAGLMHFLEECFTSFSFLISFATETTEFQFIFFWLST